MQKVNVKLVSLRFGLILSMFNQPSILSSITFVTAAYSFKLTIKLFLVVSIGAT